MANKVFPILAIIFYQTVSYSQNHQYFFDGNSLDTNDWSDFLGNIGSSYASVEKGRLNFYVPIQTTNGTENQVATYYKKPFATTSNWTILIGAHNSAYWTTSNGACQLQIGLLDSRFFSNTNQDSNYTITLACYNKFILNPKIIVSSKEDLIGNEWPYGPANYSYQDVSLKIQYNSTNKIIRFYQSNQGTDPINESYSYTEIGSKTIDNSIESLNFFVCQNVYDSAVLQGQMWVDNLSVSYPDLPILTNHYSLVLQKSHNLVNWSAVSTNNFSDTNSKAFYRLQINNQ